MNTTTGWGIKLPNGDIYAAEMANEALDDFAKAAGRTIEEVKTKGCRAMRVKIKEVEDGD